jgi:hypothetical protein
MRSLFMPLLYILASASACRGCEQPDNVIGSVVAVKQDCPPGLARCVAGAVEVTEGRASCPNCPCAWKRVRVCDRGCAVENVELVREGKEATSLCKGLPAPATFPDLDASSLSVTCPDESDRFFCHRSNVYACPRGSSAVAVATCTFGCASDDETLADPAVDIGIATSVMCRHDPAVTTP